MNDPTPDPAATDPDAGTDPADPAVTPEPSQDGAKDDTTGNAEAAMRRRQLRAAEAVNATLSSQVEALQKAEVERIAAERFTNPSDVFLAASLDAMRAEDGTLDPAKIEVELGRVRAEHPNWTIPLPDVAQGTREPAPEAPSFGAELKRQR